MRSILLIEPPYRNKYPPLGLMKISAYHKLLGDTVTFCKGNDISLKHMSWDRIYITTLFTFSWNSILKTIKYYLGSVQDPKDVFVGGPMASIMGDELQRQKGLEDITIIKGLLDKPQMLDNNDYIIDNMIPDYSIIDPSQNDYLQYTYPVNDAFFIHATRGCIRKCEFCAVPQIEPDKYKTYIDIKPIINSTIEKYGMKRNLMIMDNNILASKHLGKIINDIIECGFGVDNNDFEYHINGRNRKKKRYVDFNQGLDARLIHIKPDIMNLLGRVAVKPLRIAFDYADDEFISIYKECMLLAAKNGIKEVSNYILFNYNEDEPNDLYTRLEVNLELNQQFEADGYNTRIWSFPMRFSPIFGEEAKIRKHVGKKWTRKQLRGIQCILNATHGVVGPKYPFFKKAFGDNLSEFNILLWMPEKYIMFRNENIENGNSKRWRDLYMKLDTDARNEFHELIGDNSFIDKKSSNPTVMKLLKTYN